MKTFFLIIAFYILNSFCAEQDQNNIITFRLGTSGGIKISGPADLNPEYFEGITEDLSVFRSKIIVMEYRGWKQTVTGNECWTLLTPEQVANFVQSINNGSIVDQLKQLEEQSQRNNPEQEEAQEQDYKNKQSFRKKIIKFLRRDSRSKST